MTLYCKDSPVDTKRVECLLCQGLSEDTYLKDEWASSHFRIVHFEYYFSMAPENARLFLHDEKKKFLVPVANLAQRSSASKFSADTWIALDDITEDALILNDEQVANCVSQVSKRTPRGGIGPVMIQRFVVVREGRNESLCLGVHTYVSYEPAVFFDTNTNAYSSYARHGCGGQPDQEMFSILYSGQVPPQPFPNETGMVLAPIRMKPEHPSTTLPKSARIHFGRAYEVAHSMPIQPLGLIHPTSMETLLDQFEAQVPRTVGESKRSADGSTQASPFTDSLPQDEPKVTAADMEVVKKMRQDINNVLGPTLSDPSRSATILSSPEL